MSAVRIILMCIAAAAFSSILRVDRPEIAFVVAMAAGLIALLWSMPELTEAVEAMTSLSQKAGIGEDATQRMLRAAGIALLCEFGAQLCKDSGEGLLASRIEFGGRISILALSVPLIIDLVSKFSELIP